ncbi:MAG: hypothetical protein AAGG11_13000 [Pseudomonadota bacterium]
MDDRKPTPSIEDLLARRDGELLDSELHAAIDADPEHRLRVRRFELMRQDLESLPAIEPDPELWAQIQARASGTVTRLPEQRLKKRWQMPFPLATAAGVFAAVLGLSLVLGPELGMSPEPETARPAPRLLTQQSGQSLPSIDQLVDRSQTLEAMARVPVVRAADSNDPSREALLYRIAAIDAEFDALMAQEEMDPELRKKLWQQRVELLETLLAIQKDQLMKSAELH